MSLTDTQLFDFDHKRLADFNLKEAQATLAGEHGDVYRTQLVAALWIDGWLERMDEHADSVMASIGHSEDYNKGFRDALREVAAHLRQGDLIRGGILHDETADGTLVPGGKR